MLDVSLIPAAIRAFVWLYVLIVVGILIFSMVKPKTLLRRISWSTGVIFALMLLPYLLLKNVNNRNASNRNANNKIDTAVQIKNQDFQLKLQAAQILFEERCKNAGEKNTKIIENVEGVMWMKWRTGDVNEGNQFKLDDPYGSDCSEDDCIKNLLRVSKGAHLNPEEAARHATGYKFIDSINPHNDQLYRYTGVMIPASTWTQEKLETYYAKQGRPIDPSSYIFAIEREKITESTARYGITWDDISTHEDRENWIAGGSLKIIDLSNNEVIAEKIGYMMDAGQGSGGGFRSPWFMAFRNACPIAKEGRRPYQTTKKFAFQYLIPAGEK